MRSYYSTTIEDLIKTDAEKILGILANNNQFDLTDLQRNTWNFEVHNLKSILTEFSGRILFEYTIPRMGRRVDVILLINNIIFLLEYKFGEDSFTRSALDQVHDYALDLKNFQKESHNKLLVPVLVATSANSKTNTITCSDDKIVAPLSSNGRDLSDLLNIILNRFSEPHFDYAVWENSIYMPTPTIIEAAQALYRGHKCCRNFSFR